ncbi:MAG TPA: NAD(P)-binding domain-containing protein [Acidimicrobiia bacterium]|nr:NAD(P)-binding domain-containing protein [Acidimicrobiia bacterium]
MQGATDTALDVAVVGAGSAGLGIGYHLQRAGTRFVIFDRGEVAETWRSQRWDSFAVNTPNWMNGLPGSPYRGTEPDGFATRDELVASFEQHAADHRLPVRAGTTVERVAPAFDADGFVVETVDRSGVRGSLRADNVVVASGMMESPKVPGIAAQFPDSIDQIHAADYRSAAALRDGAVIVIGSGQSGCQISEDLAAAGRQVYLCTSRVGRLPRWYRGRDGIAWMTVLGLFDTRVDDLPDPSMRHAAQPQVSGVGPRGRTVSLQGMHRQGVRLLGRLDGVTRSVLSTDAGLAENIAFADDFSAGFKRDVDALIELERIDAPPPTDDPNDAPAGPEVASDGLVSLDLEAAGVSTVVWCTGFTAHFEWLQLPVIDDRGVPVHVRGISQVPGIFFLGFPWLHTRKSGIIFGIDEDARHITEAITSRLAEARGS